MSRQLACSLYLAVCLSAAGSGAALEFRTDSLADAEDAVPGDRVCATAAGECTVRAALTEAAYQWGSVISVLPGLHRLRLGALQVPGGTELSGAGRDLTVFEAAGAESALVGASGHVVLRGLSVRGASGPGIDLVDGLVSDVRVSGCRTGISGGWSLTLEDVETTENETAGVSAGSLVARDLLAARNGTGLVAGETTLDRTEIVDNRGLGILAQGRLEAGGCRIADNQGLGVRGRADVLLTDCHVTGNVGRLDPLNPSAGGVLTDFHLTLTRCQVRDNSVRDAYGVHGNTVQQSHVGTLSDGHAWGGHPAPTRVLDSTVEELSGGVLTARHATLGSFTALSAELDNTLLLECGSAWPADRVGDGNFSPPGCTVMGEGNLEGPDPLVGPLQDNGSGRWSRRPLAGSPLIDAARPEHASPGDQDGRTRPLDADGDGLALPDIGAIEACPDTDGDGACDSADCAPADPGVSAPPSEVLLILERGEEAGELRLSWDAVDGADSYDVAHGSLIEARSVHPSATDCLASTSAPGYLADAPSGSLFYLVRARNACEGGWGFDSRGGERAECR